jgi:hypothetical protein
MFIVARDDDRRFEPCQYSSASDSRFEDVSKTALPWFKQKAKIISREKMSDIGYRYVTSSQSCRCDS